MGIETKQIDPKQSSIYHLSQTDRISPSPNLSSPQLVDDHSPAQGANSHHSKASRG